MTTLDPQLTERDRDCNDGGGRRGHPTLLAAIAEMKGSEPVLKLTDRTWWDLADSVGHLSPDSTRAELRQMEGRKTVMTFSKTRYDAAGKVHVEIESVGLTTKGRELLERTV